MTNNRLLRRTPLAVAVVTALAIACVVYVVSREHSPTGAASPIRSAAPARTALKPSDDNYAQKVDWVTACKVATISRDDPIMYPGQPGKSHLHDFSGNEGVTATSTTPQLLLQRTNCTLTQDKSAYWMPALLVDGNPVTPYITRAYYRAATKDVSKINPIPEGLRMIAGNPMAVTAQSQGVAGFHCRVENKGAVLKKQAAPPQCPAGSVLEASVVFPNCWDGKNLDSSDHHSHMSYARSYVCDARHPVQVPQLTVSERFPAGKTNGTITLASMNSPYTLHADFMDGWDPQKMEQLVASCIKSSKPCATVDDKG